MESGTSVETTKERTYLAERVDISNFIQIFGIVLYTDCNAERFSESYRNTSV